MSARAPWTPDLDAALANAPGGTIEDWKEYVESLLTRQPCVFRRNSQISALYAALYLRRPELFKWAGMAAIASHHIRVALWPLRIGAGPEDVVDLPRAIGRWQALHMSDVDRIRQTNNGIFDDIFWAHLVYDGRPQGLQDLGRIVADAPGYAPVHDAFAQLDQGRQLYGARRPGARKVVWAGNENILAHEQRVLVQPNFDQLSCAFARAFSFGASAGFEVNGLRQAVSLFTSFYGYALRQRLRQRERARRLPLLTSFDDRWDWLEGAVVPRFRRYEGRGGLLRAMVHIIDEAR